MCFEMWLLILSTISTIAQIYGVPTGFNNAATSSFSTAIIAPFNNLNDVTKIKLEQIIQPKAIGKGFPDSGRKHAVLEHENLLSKTETIYGRLHEIAAAFYNPKPVTDQLYEHEKYGNDGGKIRALGTAVVGAIEGFSNVLNTAVDIPFETVRQLNRKLSTSLASIGGTFVGI